MTTMNCPYCGAQQRTSSDDADGMREEETQARECSSCEKNFTFQIKISLSYTTEKADCLNGGEHAWKPTVTWPKHYTRMRCHGCNAYRWPTVKEKKAHEIPERPAYPL